MNKKIFIKAACYGFIQSLVLNCLLFFYLSVYSSNISLKQYVLSGMFCSIVFSIVYCVIARNLTDSRVLFSFSITSMICYILGMLLVIMFCLIFNKTFLTLREVNNSDGISILFFVIFYISVSVILKTVFFTYLIIRNKLNKKRNN